jgi:L-ascorbate metabolism protein UlaG (beta-lactamase superfamily)
MECYRGGELTVYETLLASQWLGLDHIIASHYASPEAEDVKKFQKLAREAAESGGYSPKISVMKPGEVLEL